MTAETENSGWRSSILQHFSKESAAAGRLTVVSDPDELLTEVGVVERLKARGFELMTFDDPVAFRYAYESRFRRHWDRGEPTHLVVVIRTRDAELRSIPYDLLEEAEANGRMLSFGIHELFPLLATNVVAEIEVEDFGTLHRAVKKSPPPEKLGANSTRDYLLRHVFGVAPELIKEPADLLQYLLRRHYRSLAVPESLDAHFIQRLIKNSAWRKWPLERIVPSKEAFLTFLAERWPHFLVGQGFEIVPGREPPPPSIPGPVELPLDHEDVRVYMDNLFLEGFLPATACVGPAGKAWFDVGIVGSAASSIDAQYDHLLKELSSTIPNDAASFRDWQEFSLKWGTWLRLRWRTERSKVPADELSEQFVAQVQSAFSSWLFRSFGPISSLPYLPRPVLGHHVPHYLAHHLSELDRVALLVIDGMAIDQWKILKDTFEGSVVEEHALFSWIPTLTQIGRQAIFSGRIPMEFASSIEGTHREKVLWTHFWQDQGLSPTAIKYIDPQGKKASFQPLAESILEAADDKKVRVIGAVVGLIDQNMHQIGLGTAGLHGLVDVWANTGQLDGLVGDLLDRGFSVYLTADHGNTFGRGFGKPDVGATAQQRGERAHIFRNKDFRDQTAQLYPDAFEWPQIGLPEDYFALIAPYGSCFMPEGKESVSHGGIALEEVMVPFVRVLPAT